MSRRAPTPVAERRPIARRKDTVRMLLDRKMHEALEDPQLTVAEQQEVSRQIARIHVLWGWTGGTGAQ